MEQTIKVVEKVQQKTKKRKEIQLGTRITEHDLNIKIRKLQQLLEKGCEVNLVITQKDRIANNLRLFYDNVMNKIELFAKIAGSPSIRENNVSILLIKKG